MVESMSLDWKCSNEIKLSQPYQISELPPEPEQPAPAAPPAPAPHPQARQRKLNLHGPGKLNNVTCDNFLEIEDCLDIK